MSIIDLNEIIRQGLPCFPGKPRVEYCDTQVKGLYIEVSAANPGQGIYRLRYKNAADKTCHARIGTTAEITLDSGRRQAAELKTRIAAGVDLRAADKPKPQDQTLHDFFHGEYTRYASQRKRSFVRDIQLFKRIDAAYGNVKLANITRHMVVSFQTSLQETGLAPASINHHAKLSRRMLNLAVEWQMLEKNPLNRIALLFEDNKIERYMNEAELERLLAVLKSGDYGTVALVAVWLLSTGARCGEALKAQYSQIDVANRVWRLPASNTKARKVRAVPLNDSALDVLKQLGEPRTEGFLFVNKRTEKPYVTIMKTWTKIRTKAGLPKLRIHDLRHQYASFLVNAGRSLFEVQSILGHSSPSVTQRYSHLSTKSLQDAANSASLMIQRGMQAAAA